MHQPQNPTHLQFVHGNPYQAAVLSNVAGDARSELPRIASLSLHDLEARAQDAGDFVQSIVQVPVRR